MALLFYNLFLSLYRVSARLISFRNRKAAAWIKGRAGLFDRLRDWRSRIGNAELIWMHCASLGEFEQGRPVLEKLRVEYPRYKFLLTFFSPSGYENRKNFDGADGIFYLPLDGKVAASRFIEIVNPSLVVWIKYEYWYYFLTELHRRKIPLLLVSGLFRPDQAFFKGYGGLWRKMLRSFSALLVQDDSSAALLRDVKNVPGIIVSGDTRFDRVISLAEKENDIPEALRSFCAGKQVVVAGSTWEEDEELLAHYARTRADIIFIIAPHEIDEERLRDAEKLFTHTQRLSAFNVSGPHVVLIDNIGMLARLYRLADVTYVGGGFNASGIHNSLEAAVYGKPLLFGPNYFKFREAKGLINQGAAFSTDNALAFEAIAEKLFTDKVFRDKAGAKSAAYVRSHAGATANVLAFIQRNRLLTN